MSNISHSLTINTGEAELFSVRWSPDDTVLAAASSDGTVKIYNLAGLLINTLTCYNYLAFPVTAVR